MAKQHKKQDPGIQWFAKKLTKKINNYSDGNNVFPAIQKIKTSAIKRLGLEETMQFLQTLERNHPLYFQNDFDFKIVAPKVEHSDDVLSGNFDNPKINGIIQVTSDGVFTKITNEDRKNGVLLGDLQTIGKQNPELFSDIFREEASFNNSGVTTLLNAISGNAIVIYIPEHYSMEGLIKVEIYCPSGNVILPVHLVTNLGENARADILIEIISSKEKSGSCVLIFKNDSILNESSKLDILRHQSANKNTMIVSEDAIFQKRYSQNQFFSIDMGSKALSSHVSVDLEGEGAESMVTGVYRPDAESKFYFDTVQNHTASHTKSDLLYKGVMGNGSFGSWKGNIVVKKGTKGTNGYQANNNLVIHETAKVESLPGLEIITDDVKCSHGVTIGNIDKNHMFYLQSRGIKRTDAESLIIKGFLLSSLRRLKTHVFDEQISRILDI